MAEASTNTIDALLNLIQAQLLDVNTALPGEIVEYSNGLARVRPVATKRFADGDSLPFPVIHNVRICWPSFSSGTAGIKGPISKGDRCLLIFSQLAVDGTDDRRMFDLQDAYAVMCDLGNPGVLGADNSNMSMVYGNASLRLTPSGRLEITAPGGVLISSPETVNTGTLVSQGTLTYQNGLSGTGGSTGTVISGDLTHESGTITSLGVKIDGSHTHSGVEPGSGNTGAPNP